MNLQAALMYKIGEKIGSYDITPKIESWLVNEIGLPNIMYLGLHLNMWLHIIKTWIVS